MSSGSAEQPSPGPRRLDEHQVQQVQPATLERYRRAARSFLAWLDMHGLVASSAEEWDDLLVEFKVDTCPTRSAFLQLVAAIEWVFPRHRGRLAWSHAVLTGWATGDTVRHAAPLCEALATLIAVHMAARGAPRLGVGLLLQVHCGLRPGELLALRPEDISLPASILNAG